MTSYGESLLLAPKALVLLMPGTTRDRDLVSAIRLAGGDPQIVAVRALNTSPEYLNRFTLLALPGGFAFEDALGTGQSWAQDLVLRFSEVLAYFIERKKPVIGIGNGFRALVNAGVLPDSKRSASITQNLSGRYECRWVSLGVNGANLSPWLRKLSRLDCPVAHQVGRVILAEEAVIPEKQIAFYYLNAEGSVASGNYPENPCGASLDIAALTNADGNILGIMPHPENHVFNWQHPLWTRDYQTGLCLRLFENGLTAF